MERNARELTARSSLGVWAAIDVALFAAGIYAGYCAFVWRPGGHWVQFSYLHTCLVACPAVVMAGMVFGLYEQQTLLRGSRIVARSLLTAAGAAAITGLIISLCMLTLQSRGVLALAALLYLASAPGLRLMVGLAIRHDPRRFLIVGTQPAAWQHVP